MDNLDKKVILELSEIRGEHCISIYMTTHQRGQEVNERHDPIKLKNYIQELRANLQQKQLKSHEIESLLRPLEELQGDWAFWRYQSEGLAIFRTEHFFKFFHSPLPFADGYFLEEQFILRPLFPFAESSKKYYLLKFGKKGASLFKGDKFVMEEVDTSQYFPSSIEEVTKYYDFEAELQGRTKGVGGAGAYHRSDDMDNKHKEHLLADYFRLIDQGIRKILGTENIPLILASVEYYQPIYESVNTYPFLSKKRLTGNFDHVHITDLHKLVVEQLQSYFVEYQNKKLESFENELGGSKISTDVKSILSASVAGRVDAAFINKEISEVWGRFNEETMKTTLVSETPGEGEPLIEKTVLNTLKNGGEVYVLDDEDMPGNKEATSIAALFRY